MMCRAFGPPESLVLEDLPSPPLAAGQVPVEVHAAGVNFPDLLMRQGKYQFKPEFPFAPGGEAAGVVVEVGPGVTRTAVGTRVRCSMLGGAFADEAVVSESRLVPIAAAIDFATAAVVG